MKILASLLIVIMMTLTSCGNQGQSSLNYKIVEVNGTKVYKNSSKASVKELSFKTTEKMVLQGESDDKEKSFITAPMPLQCDKENNIYIFDKATAQIKKFDQRGSVVSAFGGQGTGPGEYQMPAGFFVIQDSLYVTDAVAQNLVQFDTNGNFIKKIALNNGVPMMLKAVANDKAIGFRVNPEMDGEKITLVICLDLMDSKFQTIKTLIERRVNFDPAKPMNPLELVSPFEVEKNELFVAEKSTDKFSIHVYDFDGNKKYDIGKPYMQVIFQRRTGKS